MRFNTCFALFFVGLAVAQALPATKIEKKDLAIEESGSDVDRSKKSATFCVEVRPGSQPTQTCNCGNHAPMNIQPSHSSIVLPAAQPVAQPVHTLHIMQQQPCAQPAPTVNFVQPAPQPQTVNIIELAPTQAPQPAPTPAPVPEPTTPAPKPTPATVEIVRPVPEPPKPAKVVVQHLEPVETVNVVPVQQVCKEQMVVVPPSPVVLVPQPEQRPLAAVVQLPSHHCQHHALVSECNCRPQNVALVRSAHGQSMEPMHAMAIKERSMEAVFKNRMNMMPVMAPSHGRAYDIKDSM